MKSSIHFATTSIVAMLAIFIVHRAASGADRLGDWSSPRPIKYRASETEAMASSTASVDRPATDNASTAAEYRVPFHRNDEAAVVAKREALFPVAEPMRPEHVGVPQADDSRSLDKPQARVASREITVATMAPVSSIVIPQPAIEMPITSPVAQIASKPLPSHPSIVDYGIEPGQISLRPANDFDPPGSNEQSILSESSDGPSISEPATSQPEHVSRSQQDRLPVPPIETKTVSGWQLGRLASQKVLEAEDLLKRQSPMTARHHAIEALHLMAQSTDELTHSNQGTQALSQALTAVREASDFLGRYGAVDPAAMQRLVDAHSTRVLKRCDLKDIQPLRAADTYYEFARGRFVDAVGGWAVSARALIVVAKTEPISADQNDTNLSAAQVCYLRSAVACDPQNAIAANELGHELLALGIFDEARWALEHSYAQQPTAAALQNLAELHRVTGNLQLAQSCAANLAKLQSEKTRVAQVIQLSPAQFAQVSPQVMTPEQATRSVVDHGAYQRQNVATDRFPASTFARQQPAMPQPPQQQEGRVANAWNRVKQIFR